MSTNSILEVASVLAQNGDWNTIFSETKFSIYSVVYDSCGSSIIDNNLSRWITANESNDDAQIKGQPKYYSWDITGGNLLSQFQGVATSYTNSIAFKDLYSNNGNLLVSKYRINYNLSSYTSDITDINTSFPIQYAGTFSNQFLLVKLPIANPTVPLIDNSIGTYPSGGCVTVFGICIIEPGPLFLAYYCNYSFSNLTNSICKVYCDANNNVCKDYQGEYCSAVQGAVIPSGTGTSYCNNLCMTNNEFNCDEAYQLYCEEKLSTFSNNITQFMASEYHNTCACFLPDSTMKGYRLTLQDTYDIIVDPINLECWYPPCINNTNTLKPYIYKTSCGNCPLLSGCMEDVSINYDGSFVAPPVTNQSQTCATFNERTDFPPEAPEPSEPNKCYGSVNTSTPSNKKPNNISLYLIVGVPVVLIGLAVTGFIIAYKRHKNK